ncbi:MAG: hypothetical protein OXL97_01165 [Chloroflexota bacterium]|nr:hypothetical protein [Chloroflexota bacterium]MDE2884342.1 hypothetical protein [Chloroflexota bacterium]
MERGGHADVCEASLDEVGLDILAHLGMPVIGIHEVFEYPPRHLHANVGVREG